MSQRAKWLKGSAWLAGGNIASLGASAVAGVLIARSLGPGGFGLYNIFLAAIAITAALTTFGLDLHLATALGGDNDNRTFSEVLHASYLITIPISLVGAVAFFLLADGSIQRVGLLAILDLLVAPLLLVRVALQVNSRHLAMAWSSFLSRVAWVGVAAAVVLLKPTSPLEWIMAGRVATNLGEAIAVSRAARMPFVGHARQGLKWRFSILRASWPLAVSGVTGFGYLRLDQLLLASIRGRVETGLYSAGVRVAELLNVCARVVQLVCLPDLALLWRRQDNAGFSRAIADAMLLVTLPGGLAAVLLIGAGERLAILIFGSSYRGTGAVMSILAVAEIAVFLGTVVAAVALVVGSRRLLAIATFSGLVINVIGNLIFLKPYGAQAAAWSSVVAYFVAAGVVAFGPDVRGHIKPAMLALVKVVFIMTIAAGTMMLSHLSLWAELLIGTSVYLLTSGLMLRKQIARVGRWVTERVAAPHASS